MARTEASVVIKRPAAAVFAFLTDIGKGTQWQASVMEASKTSEGPVGVGATGREVRRFMGRQMETTFEVTEFEHDRKISFKSTSGPIAMRGRYTLEPAVGGTRLSIVVDGELDGVLKLAEPMVVQSVKRQLDADFGTLKDLLEASG
ncbi:MAG: SRPBCC family protein [Chloroflexota bacterium]